MFLASFVPGPLFFSPRRRAAAEITPIDPETGRFEAQMITLTPPSSLIRCGKWDPGAPMNM